MANMAVRIIVKTSQRCDKGCGRGGGCEGGGCGGGGCEGGCGEESGEQENGVAGKGAGNGVIRPSAHHDDLEDFHNLVASVAIVFCLCQVSFFIYTLLTFFEFGVQDVLKLSG